MRPFLGEEEQRAAAEAVASGWIAQGPRVAEFETAFAAYLGAAHAVAVSSCTTALHLALVVAGIGPGDEVVVPSLSFIATANAARYVGAEPVFAEVDLATAGLTPATVEAALTPATRAVIVVDQAGMPADVDAIRALCEPRGVVVVEDAACAAGSTYHGRPVGADALLAAFSFHPRKILTTGEGGMVVTSDAALAERLVLLRQHGMSMSAADRHAAGGALIEQYLEVGFNYRMTDIQAAVGLVQLGRLDEVIAQRRRLADRYHAGLADLPGILLPVDPPWGTTNHQSYWVTLPEALGARRNDVMQLLADRGISTRRGIMASHLEPAYEGHPHADLPITERLTNGSLILPLYHELSDADQDRVIEAFRNALEEVA
ncbi:MAG: DegT/DnrJ/EryC1/StrS family aminotransferase [Microthrixaceae bacterium]